MITDRDRAALRFIYDFSEANGRAPNCREMAEVWGLRTSGVWARVARLSDAGLIDMPKDIGITDAGNSILNSRDPIEIIREVAADHGVKPHLVFASNKLVHAEARSEAVNRMRNELKIGTKRIGEIFGMRGSSVRKILIKNRRGNAA